MMDSHAAMKIVNEKCVYQYIYIIQSKCLLKEALGSKICIRYHVYYHTYKTLVYNACGYNNILKSTYLKRIKIKILKLKYENFNTTFL